MVRAKFHCYSKTENFYGYDLLLHPVIGGSEENDLFHEASPSGELKLNGLNASVAGQFNVGGYYYLDITETTKEGT